MILISLDSVKINQKASRDSETNASANTSHSSIKKKRIKKRKSTLINIPMNEFSSFYRAFEQYSAHKQRSLPINQPMNREPKD